MDFIEEAKKTSVRAHGELIARLIIDTEKERIMFVPSEINHPEFLAAYLKVEKADLKANPDKVSPFVGAAVRIESDKAVEIMVGVSGLETLFKRMKSPLHTKAQVNKARNILLAELQNEKILGEGYKLKVLYL